MSSARIIPAAKLVVCVAALSAALHAQAATTGNPILSGWYADPEAHVFEGEYWIYPTYSAPYDRQTFMDAFSSRDLGAWTKHPRVLDIVNVKWAKRALWAPSIIRKDGWYYLFFGANDIQSDQQAGASAWRERVVVSGIEEGRRLPTVPRIQLAAAATYQHIGSRFTQVGDEDLGTQSLLTFGSNTIGAPLTASTFIFDPELPAYNILNLRAGIRRGVWDVAAYVNNVTDERAFTSLDRERGTRARIGYLTNQPRTFGISSRFTF